MLRLRETNEPSDDRRLLDDVRRLLLEHRGEDEVLLEVSVDGHVVTLEWPIIRVNGSPELEGELSALLGPEGQAVFEDVKP